MTRYAPGYTGPELPAAPTNNPKGDIRNIGRSIKPGIGPMAKPTFTSVQTLASQPKPALGAIPPGQANTGRSLVKPTAFQTAISNSPKYTGPGVGPTGPANTSKINEVKSMIQGRQMKKGGSVSSASKRADGIAIRGKTRA
jgi:hypothetical protein